MEPVSGAERSSTVHKIYWMFRRWLLELFEVGPSPDPLNQLTPRELADLPTHHPSTDRCLSA
jgi:hypothetical protein